MAVVTVHSDFGAQENKICHCFHSLPFYLPSRGETGCCDLSFVNVGFRPAFSLSSFTLIKRLFHPHQEALSVLFAFCHWSDIVCIPAAAAKSLQSCLTLCDPIDGSPPGSPVPGILQARTLEWVAISFSNA